MPEPRTLHASLAAVHRATWNGDSGRCPQVDCPSMSLPVHVHGLDGVRLVSPTEPGFDNLAGPMIGRIADRALKLKPLLVIVTNDSTQTVVAFSHQWTVRHQNWANDDLQRQRQSSPCGMRDVVVSRGQPGLPVRQQPHRNPQPW